MDDAKDVATLPDPARKAATETEESPEKAVDTLTEPDEGEGPEEEDKTYM